MSDDILRHHEYHLQSSHESDAFYAAFHILTIYITGLPPVVYSVSVYSYV